jgi:hypothetical protein
MSQAAPAGSLTEAAATEPESAQTRHGPGYYAALVLGFSVIGFALDGLLSTAGAHPLAIFRLLVGLNIVNDALVLPSAAAIGLLVARFVPRWLKLPLQAGLITSAVVSIYAYPLVASYGKTLRAGPSRLPWNYAHNLAVVLGVIWATCAVVAAVSWWRTRPSRSADPSGASGPPGGRP